MRTRTFRSSCVAVAMLAVLGLTAGPAQASSATLVVDLAHPAGRLPADLVGLSFEMRELGIGNLDARKGNLAQLFKTLGRSNVRIAGNTLDRDGVWLPAGQALPSPSPDWLQHVVTPSDIKRLDEFLGATGWTTEVGINLGRWDAAAATDQARVMSRVLGRRLIAAECGNEPDQWVGKGFRPAGYAYPDYRADFRACAAAVGPDLPLAGPDAASPSSAWAANLARDESRLGMVMLHQYAMDPTGTMTRLLSPETYASQLRSITPNLTAAQETGKPLRVDETNSAWGGGIDGVSNRHGSALWALDYSLQLGQAGVAGLNFHGGLGVCDQPIWNGKWQIYTPICAASRAGELAQIYRVTPIYYGLWMARQLGAGRFLPVTLTAGQNITAYAVRGDDGKLRLAVISKEDPATTGPTTLTVSVGGANRGANVLTMTGTSLTGVDTAVQGATVDSAGRLTPGRPTRAAVRNGTLSLDLAAGSAAVVTLDR
jgi:hypothetical protein